MKRLHLTHWSGKCLCLRRCSHGNLGVAAPLVICKKPALADLSFPQVNLTHELNLRLISMLPCRDPLSPKAGYNLGELQRSGFVDLDWCLAVGARTVLSLRLFPALRVEGSLADDEVKLLTGLPHKAKRKTFRGVKPHSPYT